MLIYYCIVCLLLVLPSPVFSKIQQSTNITSVILGYGYPLEVHTAVTPDGYELVLYHIPHGKVTPQTKGPVLLQHGLTDSSAGWCLNEPEESLSFILADGGYDVWIGNNRGNGYSMNNINFGPEDARFWDFSWDDMALIDFPTMINYVLTATNSPKLSYIGHSEGTIQAFAGLIAKPDIADKINVFIALAPVAYVGGITVEIMQVLARLNGDALLLLLGVHEFYLPDIVHDVLPIICRIDPSACGFGGNLFYGNNSFLNTSRLSLYTDFEPFPTSAKNIIHWAQGVRTATYERFDYGTQGNIDHYGQPTPPPYDLSKFPAQLPLVLFTGGKDALADPADVAILTRQLPTPPTVFYRDDYGHLDFLVGYAANKLTYPDLIAQLEKYHS